MDYINITSLIIWLKNTPSLSILAKNTKNEILIDTIWNIIDPSSMSKLTNPINTVFLIPNL